MSRIVNDDPASLAVAASVARRGAIGIGEASAELAALTRLLSEQWLGPQARRTRRELAVIIATADALSAELRLVSGAMHDLTSTSAQLRAEEARAREAAGDADLPAEVGLRLTRTVARASAVMAQMCVRCATALDACRVSPTSPAFPEPRCMTMGRHHGGPEKWATSP